MKRTKQPYLKQKLHLYFDENFPKTVIDVLQGDGHWQKKCKVYSALEEGNNNRDDRFHYEYCMKNKLVLVTLDKDFMNDRKYPFSSTPGVIRIVARRNDSDTILANHSNLLEFLSFFPLPRSFVHDAKFEVSLEGCTIRGRDADTREIKTMKVKGGDTIHKVAKKFHY